MTRILSAPILWNGGTLAALQRQCAENLKQLFPELKLRGLVPNSYIHGSVSDLHIPRIGVCLFCILLQKNSWTDPGNTYKSLTDT